VAWIVLLVQQGLRARRARRQEERTNEELLERALQGETVELRPSRKKWLLVLLGCVVFSAFFVPAAIFAPQPVTIMGALLFGPGAILSAWALVPGAAYLRLTPDGFVSKVPVRTRRYRWDDVEGFRVFEVRSRYHTSEFVGFDYRDRTHHDQSLRQTVNRGVSGVDEGLSDNYGIDPELLAQTLNELREKHATVHGTSPSQRAEQELLRQAETVDTGRGFAVTALVGLACAGLFAWTASRYGIDPGAVELLEVGGATGGAEWWSLLAANLLHADLFHLVLNLVAWGVVGTLLEREIGATRMAVMCVAAGLASIGLAVLIQPGSVTVGLSGVVFAALAWGVLKDLHRTRALGVVAWSMLPIGVIYTFLSPGTSIGGHLGGLAAGLLLGWSLERAR
jgi:membrane associated rhomboid family serine protease